MLFSQITGSRSYWSSKLLDHLAMSGKLSKTMFFVTLTQNDNLIEFRIISTMDLGKTENIDLPMPGSSSMTSIPAETIRSSQSKHTVIA